MKLIRFLRDGTAQWGILEGEKIFSLVGSPYEKFSRGQELGQLPEVKLLPPAEPTVMVCCGMNYSARVGEDGWTKEWTQPEEPLIFFKPPSSMVGHLDPVVFPAQAETLRYEGELCAVMKRRVRNVSEKEALNCVLGYTCGNELGAMDLMKKDRWLTRAKGFDTFAPLGPCLATDLDPQNLRLRTSVNGRLMQDGHTSQMIFSVGKIISYISSFMTLNPGDVVMTGTPEGACNVIVGDVMEIDIEGIGILRNRVIAA